MEPATKNDGLASPTSFLGLPAELIQQILAFLGPFDLATLAKTCRELYLASSDDQIWQPLVNQHLPHPISTPRPAGSFRELYMAHHPNWFLTRNRIWFADSEPSGKLLIARFNQQRGAIEAFTVVASRGNSTLSFWEKDREVIIHSFDPHVALDMNQPVLSLRMDSPKTLNDDPSRRLMSPNGTPSLYRKEILMDAFAESGLFSSFLLCRSLPESAVTETTAVWPPLRFPVATRSRNESSDRFMSLGHRPMKFSEVSQMNFRIRKWVEYTGRRSSPALAALGTGTPPHLMGSTSDMVIRMPEDIPTFSSLSESCFTPTSQKPYQGIWCGDYSGHGCEFLLITQPDRKDEQPLPRGMNWLSEWFRGTTERRGSVDSTASFVSAMEVQDDLPTGPSTSTAMTGLDDAHDDGGDDNDDDNDDDKPSNPNDRDLDDVPSGRLEAIKLTGDPNIPRGEYTFISPEIGHEGFIRVADEEIFRGARIVRSAGHIAGRDFRNDQYTPSQLILISPDRLAQYWEGFGHISYYQRVDLDALVKYNA